MNAGEIVIVGFRPGDRPAGVDDGALDGIGYLGGRDRRLVAQQAWARDARLFPAQAGEVDVALLGLAGFATRRRRA